MPAEAIPPQFMNMLVLTDIIPIAECLGPRTCIQLGHFSLGEHLRKGPGCCDATQRCPTSIRYWRKDYMLRALLRKRISCGIPCCPTLHRPWRRLGP